MFSRSGEQFVQSSVKQSIRHASKRTPPRADKRIPVQLLKDFPNVGVRGEVVKVLPSVMRNYLHMNNGATYLTKTKGPRIPIVDRSVFLEQQEKIKQEKAELLREQRRKELEAQAQRESEENNEAALSLEELSGLFDNIKRGRKSKSKKTAIKLDGAEVVEAETEETFANSVESTVDISYTSFDVTEAIPARYNVYLSENIILPITKSFLIGQFYDVSGLELQESALTLTSQEEGAVETEEVIAPGTYTLSISVPNERDPVERTLVVQ
ncbi:hypothetical protein CLIB1423_03S07206 [[Candida] railenensis]|uniref:Ribosomal protein L9 domain-containing protein n=1 Tax=[Candida] railenensis TaxID=45579 RepID=A0A9P0QML2_9ASCO|nr:hypothetical protein CLIB1423_03S07206 [[Candida] railenensis]